MTSWPALSRVSAVVKAADAAAGDGHVERRGLVGDVVHGGPRRRERAARLRGDEGARAEGREGHHGSAQLQATR